MRLRFAFAALVALGALAVEMACGEQLSESADGSGTDASVAVDANAADTGDGGATGDSSRPFCDEIDATLCWSFDDTTKGDPLFGPHFSDVSEIVSLTNQARSAPNAMEARNLTDASGQWLLKKTLDAGQLARCTIAIYVDEITNNAEVLSFELGGQLFAILLQPMSSTGTSVKANVMVDPSGPVLAPGGLANIPVRQWTDVMLFVQRSGADVTVTGSTPGSAATATVADAGQAFADGGPTLRFGLHARYGGRGTIRVDDVRCDYQ